MKKIAPLVVGLAGVFTNVSMALAQSQEAVGSSADPVVTSTANCTLNGQSVPCEQVANAVGGMFSAFAGVFFVIMLIAFVGFIFTVWMFIDCLRRDFKDGSTKALWALAMVFFNFPAAL
ncbi:PLDc N-terminal domain-containing protein, partial [Candidatus Gracilibacteria bacterium]|nr:PLDc N-terminal domain-containing protein [Candidatus Gracilibacteria bacterium]